MNVKKYTAAFGTMLTAIVSAYLNSIFFIYLLGNVKSILDIEAAQMTVYVVSLIAGIALVFGEAYANMEAKDKGYNTTLAVIILFMCAINIGAAQLRDSENARASRQDARILAADDPRFKELAAEKEYNQRHVLNDGRSSNDAAAIERNKQITAQMGDIVKEYVGDAHASGVSHSALLSIFTLVLNLVFGASVRGWYKGRDEQSDVAKPFMIPSFAFLRPKSIFKVETQGDAAGDPQPRPAAASAKGKIGFQANLPPTTPEKETVYVEVEVDKTGNIEPGYNAALQGKYAENVRKVKETMQHFAGQRVSLKKQAAHAGLAETTFRRIRSRINNGEL